MKQISPLGRFLDPIADKLLVASLIVMLVATQQIAGLEMIPAIVILAREILVSGLREYLAEIKVSVPVTKLAKWKTAIQMVALGFLIVGDRSEEHTSELQSLMRSSYAVFCGNKKKKS